MSTELANIQEDSLAVLPPSAIESMQRAEVDVQISTAHRFPRSMQTFKKRASEMATLDEDTAASCLYSRPVGGGKFAEGLSVRLAEIVAASYGNIRIGATVIEQTERYVKARGFAHDLETNYAVATEVIESTVKRDGTPYDERMRIVIAKAALAKARRDATFQVVPKALCKPIEMAARAVAVGDASTLSQRRSGVMSWIGKLGIDTARVFAALGVKGEEEIGLDELAKLTGVKTAIKDGEVTVDEAFPPLGIPRASLPTPKQAGADAAPKADPVDGLKPVKTARMPRPKPVETAPVQPDAPEPDPIADESTAGQLRARLAQSGYTEAELVYMAIRTNLCATTARGLDDIAEEKQAMILEDWEKAEGSLADIRTAKGGK